MIAKIVSGVAVSSVIRAEIKNRVSKLAERGDTPGLAVIIVGTDPACVYRKLKPARNGDEARQGLGAN
jgi:methylenetetrahydrofolate dehydrogenase (NADP+)/methenyltetrahydrofolate cyclohydrolase